MRKMSRVPNTKVKVPSISGIQFEVFINRAAIDGAMSSATKPALTPRKKTFALFEYQFLIQTSVILATWEYWKYLLASGVISQAIA